MTISLAPSNPRSGYRYEISGRVSKYAQWSQTLELPSDGGSVSISGSVVRIAFRERSDGETVLSIFSPSEITISDADTLTLSVAPSVLSGLCDDKNYIVDLTSVTSNVITHWGHGTVFISDNPPAY